MARKGTQFELEEIPRTIPGRRKFLQSLGLSVGGLSLAERASAGRGRDNNHQGKDDNESGACANGPFKQTITGARAVPEDFIVEGTDITEAATNQSGGSGTVAGGSEQTNVGTQEVIVGTEFDGENSADAFTYIPPDPILAAGPEYLVQVVNTRWSIYTKNGEPKGDIPLPLWFGNVIEEDSLMGEPFVYDPWVAYDPEVGRFYISAGYHSLTENTTRLLVSISDSSDPFGTWTNYAIAPVNRDGFVDFPKLGFDTDAIYLTENFWTATDSEFSYFGPVISILPKVGHSGVCGVFDNGPQTTVFNFTNVSQPDGSLSAAVQPARQTNLNDTKSSQSDSEYYLLSSNPPSSLTQYTIRDPTTNPQLSCEIVSVGPYIEPPNAQQPETNVTIWTIASWLSQTVFDPTSGTLWTAHNIGQNWQGDNRTRAAIRWYEIDPTTADVVQQGLFGQPGRSFYFPALDVNSDSMMMAFNVSGPDLFLSAGVAGRTNDFPSGEIEDFEITQEGSSLVPDVSGVGIDEPERPTRGGDYSGCSVDPVTGHFWCTSEYMSEFSTFWDTWITETYFGEEDRKKKRKKQKKHKHC